MSNVTFIGSQKKPKTCQRSLWTPPKSKTSPSKCLGFSLPLLQIFKHSFGPEMQQPGLDKTLHWLEKEHRRVMIKSYAQPKVIIEKSHGGRFLWNRNWVLALLHDIQPALYAPLSWRWGRIKIWACWHLIVKKKIWADYKQLFRPIISSFHGQKKLD